MIDDITAIAAGAPRPLAAAKTAGKAAGFAQFFAQVAVPGKAGTLARPPGLDLDPGAVEAENAAFGKELTARLRALGVDTSMPITLDVATDGSIRVANDHPDKDKIEFLFASDRELANHYKMLSMRNTLVAIARIAAEFHIAWEEAKSDEEREALWQQFRARIQQVTATAGRMTLAGGVLSPGGAGAPVA